MLSTIAHGDFIKLGERARPLIARLELLAAGAPGAERLGEGSLGEQVYKYVMAGDLGVVFREMSPDELMKQGFEERLARRGGIFVLDILPTHESA